MAVTAADNLRDPFTAAESCADAADLLDAIDALHQGNGGCTACDDTPRSCPTARLLHPEVTE